MNLKLKSIFKLLVFAEFYSKILMIKYVIIFSPKLCILERMKNQCWFYLEWKLQHVFYLEWKLQHVFYLEWKLQHVSCNFKLVNGKVILPRNPSQYWQLIFTVPKFIFIFAIIYLTVNNTPVYILFIIILYWYFSILVKFDY